MDKLFAKFANVVAKATGSPPAFILCVLAVVVWAASGPVFKFSETWQLVINTGTTIITFLMVFLIQNTQNRDSAAIQAKLDDLILTSEADNGFVGIEKLADKELEALRDRCEKAAKGHTELFEKASEEIASRKAKATHGRRANSGAKSTAKRPSPTKARRSA
ncbi:MAG: low affinity iron permease family protein [Caulobacteraceae bacterium]